MLRTDRAANSRKQNTSIRDKNLTDEFNRLHAIKIEGIKLCLDAIYIELSTKYFVSVDTVKKIIKKKS